MSQSKTQIKFTLDTDTVSTFKLKCMADGVSMASVIDKWMKTGKPTKTSNIKLDIRSGRKKLCRR